MQITNYVLYGLKKVKLYTGKLKILFQKLKDAHNEEKQIIIRNTFNNINTKINNWLNEK